MRVSDRVRVHDGRGGVIVQMRRVQRERGGRPQGPRPRARWVCLVELDDGERCYFWLHDLLQEVAS